MRSKSEVLRQVKKEGKTVHFANSSKTKKDTEHPLSKGASASQRAAVKFSDTTSKLPGVAGAPRLSRLPKGEMSLILDQHFSTTNKYQTVGITMKTPWYFLKGTYMVTH